MRYLILLPLLATVACDFSDVPGPGAPCTSDDDCLPGYVCPTEDAPRAGYSGVCVAPCSAGCCAEDAQCVGLPDDPICINTESGELGAPHSTPSCWES